MKLALPAILLLAGVSANAGIITLASSAANTTNNTASPTINIAQHPGWAAPLAGSQWVSTAITGDPSAPGYTVLANGTEITFSQTFNLAYGVLSAVLSVRADDTTSVVVNGFQIFAQANPAGGYPTCSADPIGCLVSTTKTFNTAELAPYLQVGSNTISFDVIQKAGSSYGLNYAGSVSETPEPATFALFGAGVGALAIWRRRQQNSTN